MQLRIITLYRTENYGAFYKCSFCRLLIYNLYRDKKIDGCVHLGIENTSCLSSSYIVHWHDDVIRREHFNS